jgi:hypothetical protein
LEILTEGIEMDRATILAKLNSGGLDTFSIDHALDKLVKQGRLIKAGWGKYARRKLAK